MTSFKQFLSEDHMTPAAAAQLVFDECFEFLDASGFSIQVDDRAAKISSGALWRGVKTKPSVNFQKLRPRSNRVPTDNPHAIHDAIDNHLEKQFGFPYRSSGLFCTPNLHTATMYGFPTLVFPVDGFSFVYSQIIRDAFIFFDTRTYYGGLEASSGFATVMDDMGLKQSDIKGMSPETWGEVVYDWLEKTKPYKNTDLKSAIKNQNSGPEIVVKCTDYYSVSAENMSSPFYQQFLIELDKLL